MQFATVIEITYHFSKFNKIGWFFQDIKGNKNDKWQQNNQLAHYSIWHYNKFIAYNSLKRNEPKYIISCIGGEDTVVLNLVSPL